MDVFQGRGIKHAPGVILVHDAHDDIIVQREFLLDLVVKNAHEFFLGQHVFRVGIDLHAEKLEGADDRNSRDNGEHPLRPLQTQVHQTSNKHTVILSIPSPGARPGAGRRCSMS